MTTRQRLTLFHNTSVCAERALSLKEEEITFALLLTSGVKALNIITAGIRPLTLKQHGVACAAQLRRLGFDALHLCDDVLCDEASAAYGAESVLEAFLVCPTDAVALAGSTAISKLNVSTDQLLGVCAGAPTEASSVLEQLACENRLQDVHVRTLLDTGLRAPQLKQLGISLASARELKGVGAADLKKLEYVL